MTNRLLGGRYRIVKTLGSGTFGQTYLAEDMGRDPDITQYIIKELKLPSKNPSTTRFFLMLLRKKVKVLNKLSEYEQIPSLLGSFEEEGSFYLVEEFICGHSLAEQLIPHQPVAEGQVLSLLQEILQILVLVHSHGIIHQCIKPSNLIRQHSDGRLILTGSGVMMHEISSQILPLQNAQSYDPLSEAAIYIAPEHLQGNPQPNSDIYALGIIAIQALTGVPAKVLSRLQTFSHTHTTEIPWHDQTPISPQVVELVDKMAHSDYRKRYHSAREILDDLRDLVRPHTLPLAMDLAPVRRATNGRSVPPNDLPQSRFSEEPLTEPLAISTIPDMEPLSIPETEPRIDLYSPSKTNPGRKWLLGAGLVLVLGLGGWFLLGQWGDQSSHTMLSDSPNNPSPSNGPLSSNPQSQQQLQRAAALQKAGNSNGALVAMTQAIQLDPANTEAYYQRGNLRFEVGDKEGALQDYTQALQLNPKLVVAYINRGTVQAELGNDQAAVMDYTQALSLTPPVAQLVAAYVNRCLSRSNLGDQPGAIADCTQAISLQPDNTLAYQNRGLAQRRANDFQAAIRDYNVAMRLNPKDAEPYYNRGLTRVDLGDNLGAIADFTQAIQRNPSHVLAYYDRGLAFSATGDKQKAIGDFQRSATLCLNLGRLACYKDAQFQIKQLQTPASPQAATGDEGQS